MIGPIVNKCAELLQINRNDPYMQLDSLLDVLGYGRFPKAIDV